MKIDNKIIRCHLQFFCDVCSKPISHLVTESLIGVIYVKPCDCQNKEDLSNDIKK